MFETTLASNTAEDARALQRLKENVRATSQFPRLVSVPYQADALSWLEQQPFATKIFWSDREQPDYQCGAGAACIIRGHLSDDMDSIIRRCRKTIGNDRSLRFFGGFSFRRDEYDLDEHWELFGTSCFVLPRFLHDGTRLHCAVVDRDDQAQALAEIDLLSWNPTTSSSPEPTEWTAPSVLDRIDRPDRKQWGRGVEDALSLFANEVVEKVVLARRSDFRFSESLSALRLARRLSTSTQACYHFCFQLDERSAFLGATPERLIKRVGSQLLSEVVAGTRPRGATEQEDEQLARELLQSAKDQLEHDIVRKCIRQRLHKYVDGLEVDSQASILKLARKQHLYSAVRATLKNDVTDGEILERLHPTPAVGGYPTENAIAEISRLEPFDRGWYAAPVGWVSADAAEFAVAIRSGLVQDDQLFLFSGAGIVPGSTAVTEWEEIEHKISDFLEVIAP